MAFRTAQTGLSRHTGYFYNNKEIVLAKKQGGSTKMTHHRDNWYPDDKKIEVATLWAVTKSVKQVVELSGVKEAVVRRWKQEPWFLSIVNQVVYEKNEILDAKLTDVIDRCASLIEDRLLNGDTKVNWKTGEQFQVPLDARGLALVMGIIFDKRQLLRGEATSRTESVSTDAKLLRLKEEFEKFSGARTIEATVVVANEGKVIPNDDPGTQEAPTETEVLIDGTPSPSDS